MAGPWQQANRGAGGAASVTQAAPTNGSTTGLQVRLRQLIVSFSGTANATDQLTVKDGAGGTNLLTLDFAALANTGQVAFLAGMDIRASVGKDLVIAFVNGVATSNEDINASGDFIPAGYPMFQS
ncbi:MAG TPA: hypothetical protein VEU47_19030 [Candidatus Cybelea sp.]|nr:hypothetical protein [Candidatus Cybelea sp.]